MATKSTNWFCPHEISKKSVVKVCFFDMEFHLHFDLR